MFRMPRNTAPSETQLLHAVEKQLGAILPDDWTMQAVHEPAAEDGRPDLILELVAPDGDRGRAVVEAKRRIEPRDVRSALAQLAHHQRRLGGEVALSGILAAPYLSPRTRELLAQTGTGWFDATGNVHVQMSRPAVLIDRQGAQRDPFAVAGARRLRSLRGPAAARVVRMLLDGTAPHHVRSLAAQSDVGVATSSRVLDLLAREELIDREGSTVAAVRKRSLAYRWAEDYGVTTTNRTMPVLAPRGLSRILRDLRTARRRYAITGTAALRAYLPADRAAVAPLSLLAVYTDDAFTFCNELALRPVDHGANVLIIEPFDRMAYSRATEHDQLHYVSPSQALVDLISGPGRSPDEGEQLLEVLAVSDPGWAR